MPIIAYLALYGEKALKNIKKNLEKNIKYLGLNENSTAEEVPEVITIIFNQIAKKCTKKT